MAVVLGTMTYRDATGLSRIIRGYFDNSASEHLPGGTLFDHLGNVLTVDVGGGVGALKLVLWNPAAAIGFDDHGTAISAGSNRPVLLGDVAIAHGTNPTAVSAAQVSGRYVNRAGVPFMIGGHPNIVTIEAAYTAAQTDTALVTIGPGLKIVVTEAQVSCDAANTVTVAARVGFGTTSTPTTTGMVLTHPGVPPGGALARGSGHGMVGVGADGEDLRVTCTVPTGGSVRVLTSFYTIES